MAKTGIPIRIINGALDRLFYPDYITSSRISFWDRQITVLEGGSHFVHLDKPAEVNKIIFAYAEEAFTRARVSAHNSSVQ